MGHRNVGGGRGGEECDHPRGRGKRQRNVGGGRGGGSDRGTLGEGGEGKNVIIRGRREQEAWEEKTGKGIYV